MEKRLANKLSMNYSTREACERQESTINELQAFRDAFQEFKDHLSEIEAVIRFRDMKTQGITQDKINLRTDLTETAVAIANSVYCYACNLKDETLMSKVNISPREILHARSALSLQRCIAIYHIAQEHIENLSGYGISASKLEEFHTKIEAFERALVKPRTAQAMRKAATLELHLLFKKTDRILKTKMDRMVRSLKNSHPQFYQEYFIARQIVDSGSRHSRKSETPIPVPVE